MVRFEARSPGSSLYSTFFLIQLFPALHIPPVVAYITSPHFSQILFLTCFKSPSPHNEVSRQKPEWQDEALRGVCTFFGSIHPPPSFLSLAPFTPEVHWMMGNAVYVWQIWVDSFQSPPLLALCLLLQSSRELPPLAHMHQEMCTSVLWL